MRNLRDLIANALEWIGFIALVALVVYAIAH